MLRVEGLLHFPVAGLGAKATGDPKAAVGCTLGGLTSPKVGWISSGAKASAAGRKIWHSRHACQVSVYFKGKIFDMLSIGTIKRQMLTALLLLHCPKRVAILRLLGEHACHLTVCRHEAKSW